MTIAETPGIIDNGTATEAMAVASTLLTVGAAPHSSGHNDFLYPVPAGTTVMQTGINSPSAEKPHEVVQRAIREIAQAAHALQQSAQTMGVPVDEGALEEAIVAKVREAL